MKLISLTSLLLSILITPAVARTVREVIHQGKIDPSVFRSKMVVSNFYQVGLEKEKDPSFEYKLKPGLSNESFKAGIYTAKEFSLNPTINSKLAMALRVDFRQKGPVRVSNNKAQFEGELSIEGTPIGSARYEFDLYDLPIRKVYNPKVQQQLEATPDGYEVVEVREIP